jgi:hypothetical protein
VDRRVASIDYMGCRGLGDWGMVDWLGSGRGRGGLVVSLLWWGWFILRFWLIYWLRGSIGGSGWGIGWLWWTICRLSWDRWLIGSLGGQRALISRLGGWGRRAVGWGSEDWRLVDWLLGGRSSIYWVRSVY